MITATNQDRFRDVALELLRFSLPLILSGVLQQLYNWADAFIVGNVEGEAALAAVGCTTSTINFYVMAITGFTLGLSILFAQRYGSGQTEEIPAILSSFSLLLGGIFLVLAALGILFALPLLTLLHTTEDTIALAGDYLRIVLMGIPFLAVYNVYSAALRGIGDSKAPFYAVLLSSVTNVVLDILLVAVLRWHVAGAAIATVISQYAAGVGIMLYTLRSSKLLSFSFRDMKPERKLMKEISSLSVLTSMQQSIMNLGILMVQGLVNSFGTGVMAAFAAGVKIDSIAYMPLQEFGNAFSTFVSQNMGASRHDRVRKGVVFAFLTALLFGLAVSAVVFLIPDQLMAVFIDPSETDIIDIGRGYLRIEGACYIGIGLLFMLYGYYRAICMPGMSVILTVLSLGTRVALSYMLAPVPGIGETGIWWSIPIGWALADLVGVIRYFHLKCRQAAGSAA